MPARIRYHHDEHIPHSLAEGLRRRGIDVTTTSDAGLIASDDLTQLAFAHTDHRVLVTQDADFLRLHRDGVPHAGIVYWHPHHRSVMDAMKTLTLLWEVLSPDEMSNHAEFI